MLFGWAEAWFHVFDFPVEEMHLVFNFIPITCVQFTFISPFCCNLKLLVKLQDDWY
jgi:hypothetical protein